MDTILVYYPSMSSADFGLVREIESVLLISPENGALTPDRLRLLEALGLHFHVGRDAEVQRIHQAHQGVLVDSLHKP